MNPLTALGVRIPIPAEAVMPLLIACGVLLVLGFAKGPRMTKSIESSSGDT